uniref:glucan endo-1,3-beta-D-glucosidase n=1 Tax=Kalanchoe fedtschenkoi TaxID=63787 RepID=A0A7N0UGG5_KALFE
MVVRKIIGSFEILITKNFRRKKKRKRHPITIDSTKPQSSPSPSPSSQTLAMSSSHHHPKSAPFLFPFAESTVLPDPTPFFPPSLLSGPLPTNSFFQNLVLKNGDQPEYIHPYLIKSSSSTLSLSYPSLFSSSVFLYQAFVPDLTISTSRADTGPSHLISSFNDLSVTLELPSSSLKFFLVRGSPYLTFSASDDTPISITTVHAILSFSASDSRTKYTIKLNNGQTWLLYSSSAIRLSHDLSSITCNGFSGIIRIAVLPEPDCGHESILDRFVSCYALSGAAAFTWPHSLEYVFEKTGWGSLLMLAHPLHLNLLSPDDGGCFEVLDHFKYKSIDGDLVGVVGDSWMLKPRSVPVTWHSIKGVDEEAIPEITSSLSRDVHGLDSSSISTQSSYFYGKLIARAARLALIAEEVCHLEVIPVIRKYLKETIEPWLNGDFQGNGFLYESKWGGIVTKQGLSDYGADFGFGVYNDHHYHLGYFLYGIAVLAKIDPAWGRKHKPQAYSLMADFMTVGKKPSSNYPRLRNFDLWKLHSWAGGLTEFADGRNQESTSEAINAYYSAALMGLAYGDAHLVATGSMLASLEIQAAQTWWHIRDTDTMYGPDFTRENKVVGVLWANKRDSGLWFAPPEWKECRLGIQLLPLLPISEVLFSDVGFVRQLVNWTLPALRREGVGEGWKGFVYALEGVYDKEIALEKIRGLNAHDDGNTLTNLLWWVHSRGVGGTGRHESGCQFGWFSHYCD